MFQMNKCQLTIRYWYIIDENGVNEEVYGDGVVGEFLVMILGVFYEYISCIIFFIFIGIMKGYYEFQYFNKKGGFYVEILLMNFKSFFFVIVEKRCLNLIEGKFKEESSSFGFD